MLLVPCGWTTEGNTYTQQQGAFEKIITSTSIPIDWKSFPPHSKISWCGRTLQVSPGSIQVRNMLMFLISVALALPAVGALKASELPPLVTLENDGIDGLYVNMLWHVGRANGELNLRRPVVSPSNTNRLYVDVGLEFGTQLACNLFEDPTAALLGFEAHPVNFGVSFQNLIRHRARGIFSDRILLLPMGKWSLAHYWSFLHVIHDWMVSGAQVYPMQRAWHLLGNLEFSPVIPCYQAARKQRFVTKLQISFLSLSIDLMQYCEGYRQDTVFIIWK